MIDDISWLSFRVEGLPRRVPVLESYAGTDIVRWYGTIERQIQNFLDTYDAARNATYVDKLRAFLKIWRENELTGSLNREPIERLKTAAELPAVDNWQLANYFSTLRDSLRELIASEEELPPSGSPELDRKPSASALGNELPSDYGPEGNKMELPKEPGLTQPKMAPPR